MHQKHPMPSAMINIAEGLLLFGGKMMICYSEIIRACKRFI